MPWQQLKLTRTTRIVVNQIFDIRFQCLIIAWKWPSIFRHHILIKVALVTYLCFFVFFITMIRHFFDKFEIIFEFHDVIIFNMIKAPAPFSHETSSQIKNNIIIIIEMCLCLKFKWNLYACCNLNWKSSIKIHHLYIYYKMML